MKARSSSFVQIVSLVCNVKDPVNCTVSMAGDEDEEGVLADGVVVIT